MGMSNDLKRRGEDLLREYEHQSSLILDPSLIDDVISAPDVEEAALRAWEHGLSAIPIWGSGSQDDDGAKRPKTPYSSRMVFGAEHDPTDIVGVTKEQWRIDAIERLLSIDDIEDKASLAFKGCEAIALVPDGRFVMFDADTPEETAALTSWWKENSGESFPGFTVHSPGVNNSDHKDGGHLYAVVSPKFTEAFDRSEVKSGEISVGDSHFRVQVKNNYCLIPPSHRVEGHYTVEGRCAFLPEELEEKLIEQLATRRRKVYAHKPHKRPTEAVDGLSEARGADTLQKIINVCNQISWSKIMDSIHAFTHTGQDSCGCDTYYFDGASQQRCLTTHDCSMGDFGYIWSDSTRAYLGVDGDIVNKWHLLKNIYGGKHEAKLALGITKLSDYEG